MNLYGIVIFRLNGSLETELIIHYSSTTTLYIVSPAYLLLCPLTYRYQGNDKNTSNTPIHAHMNTN